MHAAEDFVRPAYTGRERRWMTRSLCDWTYRTEHHHNRFAREEARDIAILEKLYERANKRRRRDEASAIFSGMYELQQKLAERRKRIANDCAPWFDGSAFERRPAGPVVCSFADELAGKAPPTFGPAAEGRAA